MLSNFIEEKQWEKFFYFPNDTPLKIGDHSHSTAMQGQ